MVAAGVGECTTLGRSSVEGRYTPAIGSPRGGTLTKINVPVGLLL